MEYLSPVILAIVFGLFAVFVKPVRITSCTILATVALNLWMMEAFNVLAAQGETVGLLMMSVINLAASMALLSFYGYPGTNKAWQQAGVFFLFAVAHTVLAGELVSQEYFIYDMYEGIILGLTAAHIIVMGGYYEELFKNIKKSCGGFHARYRHYFIVNYWSTNRKHRASSLDSDGGISDNDIYAIVENNKKRKKGPGVG